MNWRRSRFCESMYLKRLGDEAHFVECLVVVWEEGKAHCFVGKQGIACGQHTLLAIQGVHHLNPAPVGVG